MTHIREACVIGTAVLVLWMAHYAASESGWLYVYIDQFNDVIDLTGGALLTSAALGQLVKGVLQ